MENPHNSAEKFIVGPFSENSFDLVEWQSIKDNISLLDSSPNPSELFPQSKQLLQLLSELNTCSNVDEYFGEPLIKEFFFGEFFTDIFKSFMTCKSFGSLEIEDTLVSCLRQMLKLWLKTLPEDSSLEDIPEFHHVVWKKIIFSPVSEIESFTKNKIDTILEAFNLFLDRMHTISEKQEIMQNFKLRLCALCFDSEKLQTQLIGLEIVIEIIQGFAFLNNSQSQAIRNSSFNQFLKKEGIFNKIYGPKSDPSLTSESHRFLQYVIEQDLLTIEDFNTLWNILSEKPIAARLAVYRAINKTRLNTKTHSLLNYLYSKLWSMAPQEVREHEMETLFLLYKFSDKSFQYARKVRDFCWKIFMDDCKAYRDNLYKPALLQFVKITQEQNPENYKSQIIDDCVANIKQGVSVVESIRVIRNFKGFYPQILLKTLPVPEVFYVDFLCERADLPKIILDELKCFRESTRIKDSRSFKKACYITQIETRIQFLKYILINSSDDKAVFTHKLLVNILDIIVNPIIEYERIIVFEAVTELLESHKILSVTSEQFEILFKEKVLALKQCLIKSVEGFEYFQAAFLILNEKLKNIFRKNLNGPAQFGFLVNVLPDKLEAFAEIWDLIMLTESNSVAEKGMDFLVSIYGNLNDTFEPMMVEIRTDYLTKCKRLLNDTLKKKSELSKAVFVKRCSRCIQLISRMLDESELNGTANYISHGELARPVTLKLIIQDGLSPKKKLNQLTVSIPSNSTVFNLLQLVAEHFKLIWDEIALFRFLNGEKEIPNTYNGRMLSDIGLRSGEKLVVKNRLISTISLLQDENTLHPRAERIFTKWFETYSDNERMSPEQCATFLQSCIRDNCHASDSRVKELFSCYDTDSDGFLTLSNFLEFYKIACKGKPNVVKHNLEALGERNDLKDRQHIKYLKINTHSLSKHIIASDGEYFELLFSLLEHERQIARQAWELVNRLPTLPRIISDMIMLKNSKDIPDSEQLEWNSMLNFDCLYKLCYNLDVLTHLILEEIGENSSIKDSKFREYDGHLWLNNFIKNGVLERLSKIICQVSKQALKDQKIFSKRIFSFVQVVVKKYSAYAYSTANKDDSLDKFLDFAKQFENDYFAMEKERGKRCLRNLIKKKKLKAIRLGS